MYRYRVALFVPVLLSAAGTLLAWQRFKAVSYYCSYHIHLNCTDNQLFVIAAILTGSTAVLLVVTALWYVTIVRNHLQAAEARDNPQD
jgi:hypothetical protein